MLGGLVRLLDKRRGQISGAAKELAFGSPRMRARSGQIFRRAKNLEAGTSYQSVLLSAAPAFELIFALTGG
jgi:hypothetical protein